MGLILPAIGLNFRKKMKAARSTKTSFFSIIMTLSLVFSACDKLGRQPPEWVSGMFTPDGKYYVYTYAERFVIQYSKRGASSKTIGKLTYYLQAIHCATGKKVLETPWKSKEMLSICLLDATDIWLSSFNLNGKPGIALFDLKKQQLRYSPDQLRSINPDLQRLGLEIKLFKNESDSPGLILEMYDGRQYRIDAGTGKTQTINPTTTRIFSQNSDCYQVTNSIKGITRNYSTRTKLFKKNKKDPDLASMDDFIDPAFLSLERKYYGDTKDLTHYRQNFFVLSAANTNNKKALVLSMLDVTTLQTKWSVQLPQEDAKNKTYFKERFFLDGDKMYISSTSGLCLVDLKNGLVMATYSLYKK
ncbi:MAG TPA: hypothetical protein VL053_04080 [Arachidicoccus sp.]|nr:hypothetical protein [Arachidicoccus sp.]